MDLSNLELIARAAERACVAVIDRPKDVHVREQLFNALAAVVDPTFEGDDDTASPILMTCLVRHAYGRISCAAGSIASERPKEAMLLRRPLTIRLATFCRFSANSSANLPEHPRPDQMQCNVGSLSPRML